MHLPGSKQKVHKMWKHVNSKQRKISFTINKTFHTLYYSPSVITDTVDRTCIRHERCQI